MKSYPSIPSVNNVGVHGEFCTAFYKYDGSNLRFEWTRKRGWHKFGTRNRLFDRTDVDFGSAIDTFLEHTGPEMEQIFKKEKDFRNAEQVIAFAEFVGPNSFAGRHDPADKKEVILFDVNIHKQGFMDPKSFYETFEPHVRTADVVYRGPLSAEFEKQVREGIIPGLNEGVVCKGGYGHDLWMCKIKTNSYLEKLKERYKDSWKDYWE